MLLLNGSANRDERQFSDGERFDIHRTGGHLSFGAGLHFCLGSALARMQARVALEEILKRWPNGRSITTRRRWRTPRACGMGQTARHDRVADTEITSCGRPHTQHGVADVDERRARPDVANDVSRETSRHR